MARTNLELAADFRAEALRLYGLGSEYLTVAMLLEGTHYSVPEHLRPSQEQLIARMTPKQAAQAARMTERWNRMHPDQPMDLELYRQRAAA
jgi:hypothetical protein